jgi:hypothetical protein
MTSPSSLDGLIWAPGSIRFLVRAGATAPAREFKLEPQFGQRLRHAGT